MRPSPPIPPRARASVEHPGDADEVGVEEAEAERDEESGEEPEPNDHRELGPPAHFEVMVDGRHAQHTTMEATEGDDLRDDAERLEHVEAAEDGQQQDRVAEQRE